MRQTRSPRGSRAREARRPAIIDCQGVTSEDSDTEHAVNTDAQDSVDSDGRGFGDHALTTSALRSSFSKANVKRKCSSANFNLRKRTNPTYLETSETDEDGNNDNESSESDFQRPRKRHKQAASTNKSAQMKSGLPCSKELMPRGLRRQKPVVTVSLNRTKTSPKKMQHSNTTDDSLSDCKSGAEECTLKQRVKPDSEIWESRWRNFDATVAMYRKQGKGEIKKVPQWTTLPYQILEQIFHFASYPLYDENLNRVHRRSDNQFRSASVCDWLLNVSLTCKAFLDPALTALYRNPPIYPKHHSFLGTLTGSKSFLDYNPKIHFFQIDVVKVLSAKGKDRFDLGDLIRQTPQLKELELFHHFDRPPYREEFKKYRWRYEPTIFTALEESSIRLRRWTWNDRLTSQVHDTSKLAEIHQSSSFSHVEAISFVNYHCCPWRRENPSSASHKPHGSEQEMYIARAIDQLRYLHRLRFEQCTIFNSSFSASLAQRNLTSLILTNCMGLDSFTLQNFLGKHGATLLRLKCSHNQALALDFLSTLAGYCPHLEILKVDLHYFNQHSNSGDAKPLWDRLMSPGNLPSWPTTLVELELLELRKWTNDGLGEETAVKAFFGSLWNSSARLCFLKRLVLKVVLNGSWRGRADVRDVWVPRLEKAFRRRCDPPNPHFYSFDTWKANQVEQELLATRENASHRETSKGLRYNESSAPTRDELSSDHWPKCQGKEDGNMIANKSIIYRGKSPKDSGGRLSDLLPSDSSSTSSIDPILRSRRRSSSLTVTGEVFEPSTDRNVPQTSGETRSYSSDDDPIISRRRRTRLRSPEAYTSHHEAKLGRGDKKSPPSSILMTDKKWIGPDGSDFMVLINQQRRRGPKSKTRSTTFLDQGSNDDVRSSPGQSSISEVIQAPNSHHTTKSSGWTRELDKLRRTAGFSQPSSTSPRRRRLPRAAKMNEEAPSIKVTADRNAAILISSSDSDLSYDGGSAPHAHRRRNKTVLSPSREQISISNEAEHETDIEEGEVSSGGNCDVVEISIDNIRAREVIFKVDDFLDSEPSGDEDYNGETVYLNHEVVIA